MDPHGAIRGKCCKSWGKRRERSVTRAWHSGRPSHGNPGAASLAWGPRSADRAAELWGCQLMHLLRLRASIEPNFSRPASCWRFRPTASAARRRLCHAGRGRSAPRPTRAHQQLPPPRAAQHKELLPGLGRGAGSGPLWGGLWLRSLQPGCRARLGLRQPVCRCGPEGRESAPLTCQQPRGEGDPQHGRADGHLLGHAEERHLGARRGDCERHGAVRPRRSEVGRSCPPRGSGRPGPASSRPDRGFCFTFVPRAAREREVEGCCVFPRGKRVSDGVPVEKGLCSAFCEHRISLLVLHFKACLGGVWAASAAVEELLAEVASPWSPPVLEVCLLLPQHP